MTWQVMMRLRKNVAKYLFQITVGIHVSCTDSIPFWIFVCVFFSSVRVFIPPVCVFVSSFCIFAACYHCIKVVEIKVDPFCEIACLSLFVYLYLEKDGISGSFILRNTCLGNKIEEHFKFFTSTLRENLKESYLFICHLCLF